MERSKVDPWITQFMFAVISAIRADTKTLDRASSDKDRQFVM
jgi:hypothetical protein